jgi:hypothetical protein
MSSTSWKISNFNSKGINLVLIDAYTDQVLPSTFFYEQKMSLLTASSSQPYIVPDGYETFAVPDPHKDTAGNTVPYTFIIADAATLAPVHWVSCKNDASDLTDLIISDETFTYIGKAYDFVKNIAAFPTSDLAIQFAEVMNGGDETKIEAFFRDSKDYTGLKIEDVLLVQSYYKALPYGWTGGRDTKFYLYSTEYKNNTSDDEPIGDLSLTSDWSIPLDVNFAASKLTISLKTYNDNKTTTLVFKNGTFWDNPNTDTPKVALAGSFIMPSQFTMENSRNEIEAYVVGRLNGYNVFGLNEKAPHDQDNDGGFLDIFAVHTFKDRLDLAMYFINIGIGISFLVSCYYAVKYVKNKFKSDDTLETIKKAEEIKEFITQNNELLAARINPAAPVPRAADLRQAQRETREQLVDRATRQAKVNIQEMVNSQRAGYTAISNKFVSEDTLQAIDNLDTIQGYIDTDTLAGFRGRLEEITTMLTNGNVTLIASKQNINRRLSDTEKEAYDRAHETYERIRIEQEANAREVREIQEGEDVREAEREPIIED